MANFNDFMTKSLNRGMTVKDMRREESIIEQNRATEEANRQGLLSYLEQYSLGAEQGIGSQFSTSVDSMDDISQGSEGAGFAGSTLADYIGEKGFSDPFAYLQALSERAAVREGQAKASLISPGAAQQTNVTTNIRSLLT